MRNVSAIVLAAGMGTRFAQGKPSQKPKVLFELAGRPMILYTLDNLKGAGLKEIVIVIGHHGEEIKKACGENYKYALQEPQLGTGQAAQVGLQQVGKEASNVLIVYGDDSAFFRSETIKKLIQFHEDSGATLTFVTKVVEKPFGLGRIVRNEAGKVVNIVEEKEAPEEEKEIKEINCGGYVLKKDWLKKTLPKIKLSVTKEYYLVDLVDWAVKEGEKIETFRLDDSSEWFSINTPEELKVADELMRERLSNG